MGRDAGRTAEDIRDVLVGSIVHLLTNQTVLRKDGHKAIIDRFPEICWHTNTPVDHLLNCLDGEVNRKVRAEVKIVNQFHEFSVEADTKTERR